MATSLKLWGWRTLPTETPNMHGGKEFKQGGQTWRIGYLGLTFHASFVLALEPKRHLQERVEDLLCIMQSLWVYGNSLLAFWLFLLACCNY